MNLKLCYQRDNNLRVKSYIEKLKEININPILDDEIINFSGRTINISAYEQIKSRDPKNIQVIEFKKRLMEIQLNKIKNANGLLVCNEFEMRDLPSNFLFEIFSANVFKKPIFLLNHLTFGMFASDELNAMNLIFLNFLFNLDFI